MPPPLFVLPIDSQDIVVSLAATSEPTVEAKAKSKTVSTRWLIESQMLIRNPSAGEGRGVSVMLPEEHLSISLGANTQAHLLWD